MGRRLGLTTALCALICTSALAQPPARPGPGGAPNEGRAQPGPQLKIEAGLEYGRAASGPLRLDLYRMDPSPAPMPVVVWIHGEGPLDSKTASPAVALVRPGGYAVASIEYRTGPGATLAMQLADVKAAIRWLRANAEAHGLDGQHIGVFGYGRGGQLAALAGTTGDVAALEGAGAAPGVSSRVQAAVDVAGPVTAGGLDPSSYVTADDAPFLIVHGTADAQVSTHESQKLISALKVGKVQSTLDMPFAVGHDLGALLSPPTMEEVGGFFDQNLKGMRVAATLSSFVATPPGNYVDPIALDLGGALYRLYPTPARGADAYASYRIYLPPGYDHSPQRRYPVIYFLHGRSVDSKRPITAGYVARADAAIRSGVMPPTIIVIAEAPNTGWYMDTEDGKRGPESVIMKDLIPYVDGHYRTIPRREARAIEGHSMGGFGALRLGFKYPDMFVAVTGNSPANIEEVTDDMGTQAYWESQSLAAFAKANVAKLKQQKIRVIIGDQDGLFPRAKKVDDLLTGLSVPHTFTPVPGSPHNHDQLLQYESFDTMAFYGDVFRPFAAPKSGGAGKPKAK